jgi:hypothetical protein
MADAFTTRVRLEKPEVNANDGTWGTELNENMIDMVDEAVAGVVSVSLTAGNVTLSTNNGTADEARNPVIILTGTPGTTRTVTFPNVEGVHDIFNNSDSSATLGAGGGSTVSVRAGEKVRIYTDGATNVGTLSPEYKSSTFTPTLGDGTNNYTLITAEGHYTRIGDRIIWDSIMVWSSIGSAGAGQLRMGGLPISSSNSGTYRATATIGSFSGLDTTAAESQITAVISNNSTDVKIERANDNAAPTSLAANSSSSTGWLFLSGTYKI